MRLLSISHAGRPVEQEGQDRGLRGPSAVSLFCVVVNLKNATYTLHAQTYSAAIPGTGQVSHQSFGSPSRIPTLAQDTPRHSA